MRLAYNDLVQLDDGGSIEIQIPTNDANGEYEYDTDGNLLYDDFNGAILSFQSTDADAYSPEPGTIHFLADTGELIMSQDVYKELKTESDLHITYDKNTFLKNDLKPEHYFDCTKSNLVDEDIEDVIYTKENQEIRYEINFSQTMVVNIQGSDAFTHAIGRWIHDMNEAMIALDAVVWKLVEVDIRLRVSHIVL